MGIIQNFKEGLGVMMGKKPDAKNAVVMTGYSSSFSNFGDDIYLSDIVIQSIRCKANEFKKLNPRHIVVSNGKQETLWNSPEARILREPNELMTTADFLEHIVINLELTKNVFIYPKYYISRGEEKIYTGLYHLRPTEATYLEDKSGRYFVELKFKDGSIYTIPASELIHWKKDFGANDYFGGGISGSSSRDNAGLLKSLQEYDKLCQSIARSIDISCNVNGILKINTYASDEKLDKAREEFNKRLEKNQSGILVEDLQAEYTHIPRDTKIVDKDTLEHFYQVITRANGTSLPILNGDYTKEQKESYYEHALEGDIKSLGQAMSRVILSKGKRDRGHQIVLYPNDIQFMTMNEKISALNAGLPAGIFTRNEARALLGYPPIENGDEIPQGYNLILNQSQKGGNNEPEV